MKTNTQVKRNKRSYIIIALIVVLLLSAVGYAAFEATLSITGTATGSATWDVHFKDTSTGGASAIKENGKKLEFSAALAYPGDAKEITAVIENSSTMPAKVTGFHVYKVNGTTDTEIASSNIKTMSTATTTDDRILIWYEPIATDGSESIAANGGTCTWKFVVFWNPTDTSSSTVTQDFKVTFDYAQDTTNSDKQPSHGQHTTPAANNP